MIVDRGEFHEFLRWLDGVYRSPEGLDRPHGLAFIDQSDAFATRVRADLEGISAWGFDLYLNHRERGETPEQARADVRLAIQGTDEWRRLHRPLPRGPHDSTGSERGRLHREGLILRDDHGAIWAGVGVTAFTLFQAWLDRGESFIAPFVDWMIAHGVGVARALGMYNGGIGQFIPQDYHRGIYLTGLDGLLAYLTHRAVRLKLSVFADMQTRPLNETDQPGWFARIAEVFQAHPSHLLDGGNEYVKNGFDPQALLRPVGVTSSRGSGLGDGLPPVNPWDMFDYHSARGADFPKSPKGVYDIQVGQTTEGVALPVPGNDEEPMAIGEDDEPGRTSNNADDWEDYGATTKLFSNLFVLHVRPFIRQLDPGVLGPRTQACIDAALRGLAQVPTEFRLGQYGRGGLPGFALRDSPQDGAGNPLWWLRAYQRRTAHQACVVISRPRAGLSVETVEGRIAERRGFRGTIVLVDL